METTFICDRCGTVHPMENLCEAQGDSLCPHCAEEETVLCSNCGRRIYADDNAGNEDTPLCQSCYDRYFATCARCGQLLSLDDVRYCDDDEDAPYCYECYLRMENQVIHSYHYKPTPVFHGEGPRYFGVELEIDGAGERIDYAEAILQTANAGGTQNLYVKHDGSLAEGLELVGAPCSLNYHLTVFPWKDILEKARSLGYLSHAASTCGLHIHISRLAFGETEEEQDAVISKILFLVEAFWNELLKFSRRTPRQLERWASRYGLKEHPKDILTCAKDAPAGRYSCVNLQNEDTIEFRIFRGTLKLNTFIATLQMVNCICDVALSLSNTELKALSWTTFVSGIQESDTPELVQ